MTIEEIEGKIIPILERYGIQKAAIFGSLANCWDVVKLIS
jgi:predicted nucleotidyltransferase